MPIGEHLVSPIIVILYDLTYNVGVGPSLKGTIPAFYGTHTKSSPQVSNRLSYALYILY